MVKKKYGLLKNYNINTFNKKNKFIQLIYFYLLPF